MLVLLVETEPAENPTFVVEPADKKKKKKNPTSGENDTRFLVSFSRYSRIKSLKRARRKQFSLQQSFPRQSDVSEVVKIGVEILYHHQFSRNFHSGVKKTYDNMVQVKILEA